VMILNNFTCRTLAKPHRWLSALPIRKRVWNSVINFGGTP